MLFLELSLLALQSVNVLKTDASVPVRNHQPAFKNPSAWQPHIIDKSSIGADGVRLADVNQDGFLDIATAWEEGSEIRLYLNPGDKFATQQWPLLTVGHVRNGEDAVFVDLDQDNNMDVVSATEGDEQTIWIHWSPPNPRDYFNPAAWVTAAIPVTQAMSQWMFSLPLQIDNRNGMDLVVGAKGENAQIGWLEAPANPRNLLEWRWHPLHNVGWIMSLVAADMDGDGDLDIVFSDRRGENRGCFWLENPGPLWVNEVSWSVHFIGGNDKEVMFLDVVDLDQDGLLDVVAATKGHELMYYRRTDAIANEWETFVIKTPENTGTAKSVKVGDINLDGQLDIVFSCENAEGKIGVMWLSWRDRVTDSDWEAHDISGLKGIKFDLVELIDLDGDGDLDVLTSEETSRLGVIWYENPTR